MIKEIVFLTQVVCENKVEHTEENTGRYGLWTMTNLVPAHFSTSSQDDPMFMLPQFNLKLTFMVPFPVWHLTLRVVLVTRRFGSLVHGVHLDKLALMCLRFGILNCEVEMTLLTACFPEELWWTADTIIVEHFTWCKTRRFYEKVIWPSPWHYIMVRRACVLLYENIFFRQCLDNLKQPVFYSIKY